MPEAVLIIEESNPELISDEVREIISYRPHWIIRKGNTIFLIVIVFLLGLTWFIKYPDIVKAPARLVSINPPKLIASRVEGKLIRLFTSNNQQVKRGQPLGVLESTADYGQVVLLRYRINEVMDSLLQKNFTIVNKDSLFVFTGLGEIQSSYETFYSELIQTRQTLGSGYYLKKKAALEKDLQYIAALKNNNLQQKKLIEQDKDLQTKEFSAYESLANDKVIAPLELNQYKSKLIAREQTLHQADAQMTNSNINGHNKRKEILDLEKSIADQQQQLHTSLLNLKSQVEKWLQQYELTASENGKVLFVSPLQENQLLASGQPLFYIQPEQTSFYAELMAGQQGLGKVKEKQLVLMKVDGFPSPEYGYLKGHIEYISAMPNNRDSFLIKVNISKGLVTNYGKTIYFRNNITAQAEIITDNRKLFDRLIGQLKQVWER